MIKNFSAIFLSLIVCLSFIMPAHAAGTTQAEAAYLSDAGILLGSNGNLRLGDSFTVEQLMTVLARLMGKEKEAAAFSPDLNFKDVPTGRWSAPYIAWAKATGLSAGKPDGTIGYQEPVTTQRLSAFLLRVLGQTDVPWNNVVSRATEIGLLDASVNSGTAALLRGDVAKIVYRTLLEPDKDGILLGTSLGLTLPGADVQENASSLFLTFTFSDYKTINGKGVHTFRADISLLPDIIPDDAVFGVMTHTGIPASNITDDHIYQAHLGAINRGPLINMNGAGVGSYSVSSISIFSPSAKTVWYTVLDTELKTGTATKPLRTIDLAAFDANQVELRANLSQKMDINHAASIDTAGRLVFDTSKSSVKPAKFQIISFYNTTTFDLDALIGYLPNAPMNKSIQSGEMVKTLRMEEPPPPPASWILYMDTAYKVLGYTELTAQDMTNINNSYSMPAGATIVDGTVKVLSQAEYRFIHAIPNEMEKYAYVSSLTHPAYQTAGYLSSMATDLAQFAASLEKPYRLYLAGSPLKPGYATTLFYYDNNRKLIAMDSVTETDMNTPSDDGFWARCEMPNGKIGGLDAVSLDSAYRTRQLMVRILYDGKPFGSIPLADAIGGGLRVTSGTIDEKPFSYLTAGPLFRDGGRLTYELVFGNGEIVPLK